MDLHDVKDKYTNQPAKNVLYLRATSAELGVIGNKGNTFTYLI